MYRSYLIPGYHSVVVVVYDLHSPVLSMMIGCYVFLGDVVEIFTSFLTIILSFLNCFSYFSSVLFRP